MIAGSPGGMASAGEAVSSGKGPQFRVVVKVGGSLFSLPDLGERLVAWIVGFLREPCILVPGGGAPADLVRRRTRETPLSNEQAHWLAIRAMDLQARRLIGMLEQAGAVASPASPALDHLPGSRLLIAGWPAHVVQPSPMLLADGGRTLPVGWHVTSDSIAAWFARQLGAPRLILLKSVGVDGPADVSRAVANGWLDSHFPIAGEGLAVEWCNLRRWIA